MNQQDSLRSTALKIIGLVEGLPKVSGDHRRDWLAPPSLSTFQRLEPLGFGLPDDGKWWFHPSECTPDLVWPIDVSSIAEEGREGELCLQRVRSVDIKQVRGYASRFSKHMVRVDFGQTHCGKLLTAATVMAWLGGRWVDANPRVLWSGRSADCAIPERPLGATSDDGLTVSMQFSVALRQRYEWAVSIGLDGSPSIRFATDPTGMKEMFKLRDLEEGKDRRAALMNWVCDHWRQNRHDPDVEIYVRKHLRGGQAFSWKGVNVEICPSQFDLDAQEKLVAHRRAMKEAKLDKRPAA